MNPAILKFTELLDAVREHDPSKMNLAAKELAEYEQKLPGMANSNEKASFEAWFNYFAPTNRGVAFYLIAFVLGLVGIMSQSRSVRWTTFALILVTFALHTIAILCRIYISGRPPVVNLYSSAVFIGWAAVAFSMVLELIYPLVFATSWPLLSVLARSALHSRWTPATRCTCWKRFSIHSFGYRRT